MEQWGVRTLPAPDPRRAFGGGGLRALRSVAAGAAALGPAMGAASHRRRRLHALDDAGDLPSVHAPRGAAVLESARPDGRVDDAHVPRLAHRTVTAFVAVVRQKEAFARD